MIGEDTSAALAFNLIAFIFILLGLIPFFKTAVMPNQEDSVLKESPPTQSLENADSINKNINSLFKEVQQLEAIKNNLENDVLKLRKAKQLVIDINELEHLKSTLESSVKMLNNAKEDTEHDLSNLKEEKALLIEDVNSLQIQKASLPKMDKTPTFSIEYVDSLNEGLEFEKHFAKLLDKLGYYDITITSASGDFGIDVLAYNDDILYGFQCKLYSNTVSNKAVQEAYSGKNHYGCNVAVVVTNNYFTDAAKKQAKETKVILWDRTILIEKLNEASKYNFTINI